MSLEDQTHTPMPALFIGHGSPMNAIEESIYSSAWREAAASIRKPKAVLCISAHWESEGTFVTAMPQPRTIHDFYGFPDELYQLEYPAPGSPDLAARICELLHSAGAAPDKQWGLDHGAWSVLRRMYPHADVPVAQLSLDRRLGAREHYKLGAAMGELRNEGVLIVASGNIVHNLRMMQWDAKKPHSWAMEFDQQAAELILAGCHETLMAFQSLGEAAHRSIPTSEHYLPLLYILALQRPGEPAAFFAEGIEFGAISMRSIRIG